MKAKEADDALSKYITVPRNRITTGQVSKDTPKKDKPKEVAPPTPEDKIVEYLDDITAAKRVSVDITGSKENRISELLSRMEISWQDREDMCEVVGLILDKKIEFSDIPRTPYTLHCVMIPLQSTNGHDYPLGKPCVLVAEPNGGECRAKKMNGTMGNNLFLSDCRPATTDEIRVFVKAVGLDNISKVLGIIII